MKVTDEQIDAIAIARGHITYETDSVEQGAYWHFNLKEAFPVPQRMSKADFRKSIRNALSMLNKYPELLELHYSVTQEMYQEAGGESSDC